tara:strand:- start:631 stop:825 length:195 start_codon:yes stop_codon:yes gene_type:complete
MSNLPQQHLDCFSAWFILAARAWGSNRGAQQPWLTDRGREPRFGLDRPTGALFKISQTAVWRRG